MIKLTEGEQIVGTVRKHWFLPMVHTVNSTLLFLLPVVLILFLVGKTISNEIIEVTFTFGRPSFFVFGFSIWGLVLWLRFFSFWTDHHLDGWVVTNKRILDIEQHGFFRREIASFRLERLQDVTTETKGLLATLLKFGDVHVQTAGTDKEFVLQNAPNPKEVRSMILEQYDRAVERAPFKDVDIDGVSSVK